MFPGFSRQLLPAVAQSFSAGPFRLGSLYWLIQSDILLDILGIAEIEDILATKSCHKALFSSCRLGR
jgi:hypothetical protein